mgnify:CR=1 FL=1
MQDLQQKIIRHYGLKKQKDMLYHALSDLAAALVRGKDKKIKEDMAGVLNLLEQIIVFQGWEENVCHYGLKKQKDMLYHALSDLAAALIRGKDKKIKEEMAGVLNLLEQIIVFQGWEENVYFIKYYEIQNQLDRIRKTK